MMTLIHASPERTFSIQWSISESIFHSYQTYRAFWVHKLNKLATLKYSILVYHIYRWYLDLNNLLSTARCTGYLITNVYVVEQIIYVFRLKYCVMWITRIKYIQGGRISCLASRLTRWFQPKVQSISNCLRLKLSL